MNEQQSFFIGEYSLCLVDLQVNVRFQILLQVYVTGLFILLQFLLFLYQDGYLLVLGLAYDVFGTPRPNEYFTQDRQQVPLVNDRFSAKQELEDLTKGL